MALPTRPSPREVVIVRKEIITPNMLRLTMSGPGIADFPDDAEGGYIKLRLNCDVAQGAPIVRTYTVRAQRPREIDVDFVLHEDQVGEHGPATAMAMHAKVGDTIEIGGPGPAKPMPPGFDFYLVAGDMTALPAIAVNLAKLPHDAVGYAVIEVQHEADRQQLECPEGFDVDWVVNSAPGTFSGMLAERIKVADPGDDNCYGWAACEFTAMKALRAYLRNERGFGRDRLYISSYWKSGLTEEQHKIFKRQDSEETEEEV